MIKVVSMLFLPREINRKSEIEPFVRLSKSSDMLFLPRVSEILSARQHPPFRFTVSKITTTSTQNHQKPRKSSDSLSATQQPPIDDDTGCFHAPPSKIENDKSLRIERFVPDGSKRFAVGIIERFVPNVQAIHPRQKQAIQQDVLQIYPKPHASDLLSTTQQPPFDDAII